MLTRPKMGLQQLSGMTSTMSTGLVGMPAPWWSWSEAAAYVGTWTIMMAAMMLPSATPMIALFNTVARSRTPRRARTHTLLFALAYLALWSATGVPVYAVSAWAIHIGRTHAGAHAIAPYLVVLILGLAGIYQFSRSKRACLTNCQNPIAFLAHHWQTGIGGTLEMGARHAAYCLGCCIPLMVVLVAAGSMGLAWVLLIAVAVLAEKTAPPRLPIAAVTGLVLIGIGVIIAVHPSITNHI